MRMYDLIRKKRDGERLAKEEIDWMIRSYTNGEIPDYQMSALMMAIYFRGMNEQETLNLTLAMADSGERLDLSAIHGIKVDKHSTGGVGDKTSLALVPLVASCGIPVAKMSGRGLGHTGGTIDKLESFSGFSTAIPVETFIKNVNTIGISIMGQTADLAPADKKLYALRDVTATVDNLSLIASSIMSKKLAAGADAIVLDVKTGSGAFMKSEEDAFALAEEMVTIGKNAGRQMHALITDMDQPLGYAIGNALEVKEAIATLNGSGPEDFTELVLALGSRMLIAGKKAEDVASAEKMLRQSIQNGDALRKLEAFVKAQEATQTRLPMEGTVLISVNDKDKDEVVALAKDFDEAGFKILASKGTKALLDEAGIPSEVALKLQEGRPNILDLITNGKIDLIVNTPDGGASGWDDSYLRKNAIKKKIPYMTTMAAAKATISGIKTLKEHGGSQVKSLQELHAQIQPK